MSWLGSFCEGARGFPRQIERGRVEPRLNRLEAGRQWIGERQVALNDYGTLVAYSSGRRCRETDT